MLNNSCSVNQTFGEKEKRKNFQIFCWKSILLFDTIPKQTLNKDGQVTSVEFR